MSVEEREIHKESWFKSIFKHGKWYILSSIFTKGVGIILLRVYTDYLTPSEYGILESLRTISALLPIFISLYLDAAFVRFYHDYKSDKDILKQLFSSIYWFVLLFGTVVVFLALFSSKFWVSDLLEIPFYPYALLAFIAPLFMQIGQLGIVFLRQSLQAKKTSVIEVISVLINVAVVLPLLIVFDFGVLAKLWANLITALLLFVYYTYYFIRIGLLRITFNKKLLITSLAYSLPLMPNIAAGWIASLSDRLIIAKYVDTSAVGLYSVGYSLGMLLYILQDAITQVLGPISMSGLIRDKSNTEKKIAAISRYLWAFMLFSNFMLFLFSKEILYVFSDEAYSEAYFIIPIVGFMYVLSAQYRLFSSVISFKKKTVYISFAAIFQAVVNLGLNFIFIPMYGYMAAAITSVVSMLVYTLLILFLSQRLNYIELRYDKYLWLGTLLVGFVIISYNFVQQDMGVINLLLKIFIALLAAIIFAIVADWKFIKTKYNAI